MKRLRFSRANGDTVTLTVYGDFSEKVREILTMEMNPHGGLFSTFGENGDKIEVEEDEEA